MVLDAIPLFLRFVFVDFGIQLIVGALSILFKTERYFDLTGSMTFLSLSFYSLFSRSKQDFRHVAVSVFVVVWALRLGSFLFIRISKDGHDKRFDKIRGNPTRFLVVWLIQGVWVLLTIMPLLMLNLNTESVPLGPLDYIGWTVWFVGFTIEIVADFQKFVFRLKSANQDKFIQTGLWKYSQHPNYFGEMVLWAGVYISCLPVYSGIEHIGIISPIFVYFLLTRVSGIPLLKKSNEAKFGRVGAYADYVKKTNLLIPGPTKN